MTEVLVRYVTLDDKEDWLQMWKQFRSHYDAPIPEGLEELNYKRFLDPKESMWSALAFDKDTGMVLGMVNFLSRLSTWDLTDIIYLNDLYVNEKVRSQGIGRKLIEFVYSEADKMGTPYVYWITDHHNHRAQLLYTKVGKLTDKRLYERPDVHRF